MTDSNPEKYLLLAGVCIHSPDIREIRTAIINGLKSEDERVLGECIRGLAHLAWRFKNVETRLLSLVHLRALEMRHSPHIQELWAELADPEGDIGTFVPLLKVPPL